MNKTETMTVEEFRDYWKKHSEERRQNIIKSMKRDQKIKEIIMLLKSEGFRFETEFKFHPERKWRFDIAFPDQKIAIEYEGIFSKKSRHTSLKGFTGDTQKYNEAAKMHWTVLRYTSLTTGNILTDLKKIIG